jgi:hypothetical protein
MLTTKSPVIRISKILYKGDIKMAEPQNLVFRDAQGNVFKIPLSDLAKYKVKEHDVPQTTTAGCAIFCVFAEKPE